MLSATQPAARQAEYDNERALYDLTDTVSSLTTALEKSRYAATPPMQSALLCQLISSASSARQALSCLETGEESTAPVSKFLSQTEDYSMVLLRRLSTGETPFRRGNGFAFQSRFLSRQKLQEALQNLSSDFDNGLLRLSGGTARSPRKKASSLPMRWIRPPKCLPGTRPFYMTARFPTILPSRNPRASPNMKRSRLPGYANGQRPAFFRKI